MTQDRSLKFDDLVTSTQTVMVYTNLTFNQEAIYRTLPITEIEVPLTKKQKNVDKKKIRAPQGSIISIQSGTNVRGIDMRKKKKSSKSVDHFLNQVTIELALGGAEGQRSRLLNIMLFRDNFKIAGCKSYEDVIEAVNILWERYLRPHCELWRLKEGEERVNFLLEVVMHNIGFNMGFFIDREKLNLLMNRPEYKDKVYMSQYESTGHTNVNIKMFSTRPKGFTYDVVQYPLSKDTPPRYVTANENPYRTKKGKKKYTTFIVFSSSEVILSGRYIENMRKMFDFFVDVVTRHRSTIEENLNTAPQPFRFEPQTSSSLRGSY